MSRPHFAYKADGECLHECEAHIWVLQLVPSAWADAERDVSEDERIRARRFRSAADRCRFLVGRAALRRILSRYIGTPAASIQFLYNQMGKPELSGAPLGFNFSHSGNVAAAAVVPHGAVGIDVEKMALLDDPLALARHAFVADEVNALRRLSGRARLHKFYRLWTVREALLKAAGAGLPGSSALEVAFDEHDAACVVRTPTALAGELMLSEFTPDVGYAGAIAWKPGRHSTEPLRIIAKSRAVA